MSETSADERAETLFRKLEAATLRDYRRSSMVKTVADDFRTAVEAETERCAKFDPLAAQCTQCEAVVGMPCHANLWGKDNPQICADRIRAAIRQNPIPSTRQESGGEGDDA